MNLAQLVDPNALVPNRWSWLSIIAQLSGEPCAMPSEVLAAAKDAPPTVNHLSNEEREDEDGEEVAQGIEPRSRKEPRNERQDAGQAECVLAFASSLPFQENWRTQRSPAPEAGETPAAAAASALHIESAVLQESGAALDGAEQSDFENGASDPGRTVFDLIVTESAMGLAKPDIPT